MSNKEKPFNFSEEIETKEDLFQAHIKKIETNYPLLNILRLKIWNININISFDNLKQVNDNFSKEKADTW